MKNIIRLLLASCVFAGTAALADDGWQSVKLKSQVDHVQPWTGIVLWTDHDQNDTDAIQLEYRYCPYDEVCVGPGKYDWTKFENLLDEVAARGHQLIPRFYFVYPGKETTVPAFIKQQSGYSETIGKSEGEKTSFVDWSSEIIKQFTLDFYSDFAAKYDRDPRIAYLQTGFGLWSEYHIYSGPRKLGKTFPDKQFQKQFLAHMDKIFQQTPWMLSIDSADNEYSPFEETESLLKLRFGLFDDSFLCKPHAKENAQNWRFFGKQRWHSSPAGGEFSYYKKRDQKEALSENGPNGRSFEDMGKEFAITFMIGNDQPRYQTMDRIRQAGIYSGYRLRVTEFVTTANKSKVTIVNHGIAPMYHDAFATVNGVRATESLKGLLPQESRTFVIDAGGDAPKLSISSDRLTKLQSIQFDAELN